MDEHQNMNPGSGRRRMRRPEEENEQNFPQPAEPVPAPKDIEPDTQPVIPSPPPFDAPLSAPFEMPEPLQAMMDDASAPHTPPEPKIVDPDLYKRWHVRTLGENDGQPVRHVDLELARDQWGEESLQAASAIQAALDDPDVSEIKGNGHKDFFIKRKGVNERLPIKFENEADFNSFVEQMVVDSESLYSWDDLIERRQGVLKLAGGDSLTVWLPPVVKETHIIVRKHNLHEVDPTFFIENGTMTENMMEFLASCVKSKVNILFVGDVGSGKTTLLNAMTHFFHPAERVGIIEQVQELTCKNDDVIYMTYQPMATAEAGTSLYDVLDGVLYSRIQRLIIGEIHDEGLTKMLKLGVKGTKGFFSAYHADDVQSAIERLKLDLTLENRNMTSDSALALIRHSVELIIVMEVIDGKHRIAEIAEIDWRQSSSGQTAARTILFSWDQETNQHVVGKAAPNDGGSIRKKFKKAAGVEMNDAWFYSASQFDNFTQGRRK